MQQSGGLLLAGSGPGDTLIEQIWLAAPYNSHPNRGAVLFVLELEQEASTGMGHPEGGMISNNICCQGWFLML